MKINPNFKAFDISARGMGLEKRKMDLIAENLANVNTTKTNDGTAYKRKYIRITEDNTFRSDLNAASNSIKLKTSSGDHFPDPDKLKISSEKEMGGEEVLSDSTTGDKVYMPEHPDADPEGYVQMPNVNVVTEMVDMIAATRGYEANLTAFNASKQLAKESLEI